MFMVYIIFLKKYLTLIKIHNNKIHNNKINNYITNYTLLHFSKCQSNLFSIFKTFTVHGSPFQIALQTANNNIVCIVSGVVVNPIQRPLLF